MTFTLPALQGSEFRLAPTAELAGPGRFTYATLLASHTLCTPFPFRFILFDFREHTVRQRGHRRGYGRCCDLLRSRTLRLDAVLCLGYHLNSVHGNMRRTDLSAAGPDR